MHPWVVCTNKSTQDTASEEENKSKSQEPPAPVEEKNGPPNYYLRKKISNQLDHRPTPLLHIETICTNI